jgi:hypothetical protein
MPKTIFNEGGEVFVFPPCWQGPQSVKRRADEFEYFKVGELVARTETVRGSWRTMLERCD